jgi:hypothetical protein
MCPTSQGTVVNAGIFTNRGLGTPGYTATLTRNAANEPTAFSVVDSLGASVVQLTAASSASAAK